MNKNKRDEFKRERRVTRSWKWLKRRIGEAIERRKKKRRNDDDAI